MVQRICILILGVKEFNQMTDNLCLLYNFLYVLMYACVCVFVVCVCLCMLYVCVFVCCMCGSLWVHFFGWLKKWSNISVSLSFLLWSWSKSEYSKKKKCFLPHHLKISSFLSSFSSAIVNRHHCLCSCHCHSSNTRGLAPAFYSIFFHFIVTLLHFTLKSLLHFWSWPEKCSLSKWVCML